MWSGTCRTTSPRIFCCKLFAAGSAGLVARAVLMMQREVAERVAAAPGVRDYGSAFGYRADERAGGEPVYACRLPRFRRHRMCTRRCCGWSLRRGLSSSVWMLRASTRFLKQCFAQKRKTLQNNLRAAGYSVEDSRSGVAAECVRAGTGRVAGAGADGGVVPFAWAARHQ